MGPICQIENFDISRRFNQKKYRLQINFVIQIIMQKDAERALKIIALEINGFFVQIKKKCVTSKISRIKNDFMLFSYKK